MHVHVFVCAGKLTVHVSEALSLSGEMNETSQKPEWLISFYATLLTGSSVFMPHYQLADQFLCHTVDWLVSFYAELSTG